MKSHPQYFDEAVSLAMSDKQPYSWRAAWLLWSCMDENDRRIKKYLKSIVNSLKSKNDSHQRELLKILLQMELRGQYESYLFDICITIWETITKSPSVRITALKMIMKIVNKHPELSYEINYLIQNHYLESLSQAARKSVFKMIKKSKIRFI